MFFKSLIAASVLAASFVPFASALTITSPGAGSYWIFGTSNTISWTYNNGDANPISITVTNPDNSLLNGVFSIAQNVQVSQKSFTVTQVTLKPGSGYIVNFVNATNTNQTYVSSGSFDVKPAGYGVTTLTTVSFSASGTASVPITLTETLTGSGFATATGSVNAAGTNGTATASSTSSAVQGPATAQIIRGQKSAATSVTDSTTGFMVGLAGALLGAIAVL